jgi:bacillithiol system protein YtxJ
MDTGSTCFWDTGLMTTESLHSLESWRAAITREPRLMLFKHSPICPVSARALREWRTFVASHPEVPTAFVDVIDDRDVARGLAAECGVPHQSPQAILFLAGAPAWNASHGDITAESLAAAAR